MRYAQAKRRQKLHIVVETDPDLTGNIVANVALCGKHGPWRITFNMGLGSVCKRCIKVRNRMR